MGIAVERRVLEETIVKLTNFEIRGFYIMLLHIVLDVC